MREVRSDCSKKSTEEDQEEETAAQEISMLLQFYQNWIAFSQCKKNFLKSLFSVGYMFLLCKSLVEHRCA